MDIRRYFRRENGERLPWLDFRGQMDLPFFLLTIILVILGIIMMFSASYARAFQEEGNSTYYFTRQAVFAVIGIAALIFVSGFNYQWWRTLSLPIMLISVVCLFLVLIIGLAAGGATRWLGFGSFSFQPSEVAKFAVVITFATLISSFKERMQEPKYGLWPFMIILVILAGLLLAQPHLSATIIICGVGVAMMFQGGAKLRWFFIIGGVGFKIILNKQIIIS